MLTAIKAAPGYRPLILAWNLMYLWTLEISPLFLQKLSLYLGADQTQRQNFKNHSTLESHATIKKQKM